MSVAECNRGVATRVLKHAAGCASPTHAWLQDRDSFRKTRRHPRTVGGGGEARHRATLASAHAGGGEHRGGAGVRARIKNRDGAVGGSRNNDVRLPLGTRRT